MRTVTLCLLLALLAAACTTESPSTPGAGSRDGSSPGTSGPSNSPPPAAPSATPPSGSGPRVSGGRAWVDPRHFDVRVAQRAVEHLAGRIGPRHATSDAHRRAARWIAARLREDGYRVRVESFDVPGGSSWGVPVAAGRSVNVVAEPPGLDPARPHLVVGAHLDTVPQAPGAEDNASGVGVLLAVAGALAERRARLPVVLVAFGAEEPRGAGDDDHHFGSRHHVARMPPARAASMRAMVSLDRVGVGDRLPVCSAGAPDRLRAQLLASAERAGVPTLACEGNRASDHWSFVRAGLPAARLGSTSYTAYHSEADLPPVVRREQLRRAGRTVLAWLGRPLT